MPHPPALPSEDRGARVNRGGCVRLLPRNGAALMRCLVTLRTGGEGVILSAGGLP